MTVKQRILATVVALALCACQSSSSGPGASSPAAKSADGAATRVELQRIDQRLTALEKRIEELARQRPAARARPPGPDPKKVYAAPIAGAPFVGAKHAKVTIVEAMEFACPYCERVRGTLRQLLADYPGDIKIVYKHYLIHPDKARDAAYATCAANLQGRYESYAALVWDQGFLAGRNLGMDNLLRLAKLAEVDMNRFRNDMKGACPKIVSQDQRDMALIGTRGTPAFYINGRFLSGARPIHHFKELIDVELKKANERIAAGTSVEDYYDQWVLKRGLKKLAK